MEGKEIKKFTFNWRLDKDGHTDCGVSRKGFSICRAPRYQEKEKWEKDAALICDAFEVYEKTGMTPATLQAELEKAKELLREARDWMKEEASIKMRNGANRDVVDSYDDKAYKLTKFLEAK